MLIHLLVNVLLLGGSMVLFFAACGIANNCDELSSLENRILDSALFVPGSLHLVTLLLMLLSALDWLPIEDPLWFYLPVLVSAFYWLALITMDMRKNRYRQRT